jgi:hypothetical protein
MIVRERTSQKIRTISNAAIYGLTETRFGCTIYLRNGTQLDTEESFDSILRRRTLPNPKEIDAQMIVRITETSLDVWDKLWLLEVYYEFVPHEINWGEIPLENQVALRILGEYLVGNKLISHTELPPLERYSRQKHIP